MCGWKMFHNSNYTNHGGAWPIGVQSGRGGDNGDVVALEAAAGIGKSDGGPMKIRGGNDDMVSLYMRVKIAEKS